MLLSLLAFGGRAAFFLTLVALFGYALLGTLRNLVRGHYSYRQITGGLVLAVLFVTAVVSAALTSDLGNRIFGTLAREESARARWTAWRCLAYLRGDELAFGIPPEQITRIVEELGLVAIENFWLGYLLQFGVVGFVAFASGLFAALGWLFRRTTTEGRLALVLFLVVASSNNSLAAKSCALTVVAAVVIGWRSVADERAAYLKRASRLYPA
jgi:hypothetical protein